MVGGGGAKRSSGHDNSRQIERLTRQKTKEKKLEGKRTVIVLVSSEKKNCSTSCKLKKSTAGESGEKKNREKQ